MYQKKKGQSYYTNRHSCFLLTYHLVLVTKFRNPVLQGNVRESVFSTIRDILTERDCGIMEMNGEADHIHVLFEAGPEVSLMELVNVIKTKTARFARRDFPDEVQKYYWKQYFWTDSYFVMTVGSNTIDVVTEYIRNQ